MLKDIKVTLYDIFGYLLPGAVLLAAIAILFWTIFIPRIPLMFVQLTVEPWVLVLLLAYLSGHMAQALGNLLEKFFPSNESLVFSRKQGENLPEAIVQAARSKASEMLGIDFKDINPEWLYKICDETLVQSGITQDREVYQYREGFYRGLIVSLSALSLCLIVRIVVPGASINISNSSKPVSYYVLLFFLLFSLAGSLLSFRRYRRFARYRITRALIGFLALQGKKAFQNSKEER